MGLDWMPEVALYSVSSREHFLGTVALLNSVRLTGHSQPMFVLDCGLLGWQRALLAREAELVPATGKRPPHLLKAAAPLANPAGVMVLLDADMIITRDLAPLIAAAGEGRIVAFTDVLQDRHEPRWGELLGLPSPRRQPYINSGFLALPHQSGVRMLTALERLGTAVDVSKSMTAGGDPSYPFYFLDQDAINAFLATSMDPADLLILPAAQAPHQPFRGIRIIDSDTLSCRNGHEQPILLHHVGRKPWLHHLPPNPYTQLLPRLLLAPDLPIRLPDKIIPHRLRTGHIAGAARVSITLLHTANHTRRRAGIRRPSRAH